MDLIRTEGLLIFHKLERHIVVYCGETNNFRFISSWEVIKKNGSVRSLPFCEWAMDKR